MAKSNLPQTGLHKVRVLYGEAFEKIEILPYEIKPITTLRLVNAEHIRYSKKYANRSSINALVDLKQGCDDVLMMQHGFVTDTSYANVAFYNGVDWYTPSTPMLRGTMRAYLLAHGTIKSSVIRVKDLDAFTEIRLFNSMMTWEEAPCLPISQVVGRE